MSLKKETLRGYILEEVIAYLIRTTGYKLLVDPRQDHRELAWRGNGLVVKGRGADHQVDVLGQLEWIPAFTYPLRLFVEAKFRIGKTGISTVRNAVGVLLDINQNNSPTRERRILRQKYQYVYALFSTSGFTKPAIDMAFSHLISLIDLSIDEFLDLRNAIDRAADNITQRINHSNNQGRSNAKVVATIRYALRSNLEILPSIHKSYSIPQTMIAALQPVIEAARNYDQLFVAMANGPYMLVMKANEPISFVNYAQEYPNHEIDIRWSRLVDNGLTWMVHPLNEPNAYRLSFRLPTIFSNWIFGNPDHVRKRARHIKGEYFSNITVYYRDERRDYLFKLRYDPSRIDRHLQE